MMRSKCRQTVSPEMQPEEQTAKGRGKADRQKGREKAGKGRQAGERQKGTLHGQPEKSPFLVEEAAALQTDILPHLF